MDHSPAHHIFVNKIREVFNQRIQANPNYSLRAFSHYLKIDQSYLSKLLKGKKKISLKMMKELTPKLGLSKLKLEQILQNDFSPQNFNPYLIIEDEELSLISSWKYFALIELIKTKEFKFNVDWIAQRLGVHKEEVLFLIDKLVNLKFIKIENNKIKLLRPRNSFVNNEKSSVHRRTLQLEILEKAKNSILDLPIEVRDQSSLCFAINQERLPELKEKISQFRREMGDLFKNESQLDEVYQLSISLYPLTVKKQRI